MTNDVFPIVARHNNISHNKHIATSCASWDRRCVDPLNPRGVSWYFFFGREGGQNIWNIKHNYRHQKMSNKNFPSNFSEAAFCLETTTTNPSTSPPQGVQPLLIFSLPVLLAPGSATGGSWLVETAGIFLIVIVSCFLSIRLKQRGFWLIDGWADFFKKTGRFWMENFKAAGNFHPSETVWRERTVGIFCGDSCFPFKCQLQLSLMNLNTFFCIICQIHCHLRHHKFHQTVLNSLSHLHHHLMLTN